MTAPAFDATVPAPPTSPLVISIPHAGISIDVPDAGVHRDLDPRCDADLFVDRLYAGLAPGAFVVARLSRFICDLNRDPNDVSRGSVPDHPQARDNLPRGFIWECTTTEVPTLLRPLSIEAWRFRSEIHRNYHGAIAGALAAAQEHFGFAILLDGHSMPSRGRPGPAGHADAGRLRADIVPGDRDGQSCAPGLGQIVSSAFQGLGFAVAPNDPYHGGYTTAHHGRPAHGIHAIQIEVRRDLYMDEATYAINPTGFDRVRAALAVLVDRLAGFRPEPSTP